MEKTIKKLHAAKALLALLQKNIIFEVVGEMSEEDLISLGGLCAECGAPSPKLSYAIAQLIEKVDSLISSLVNQLNSEMAELEQMISEAKDALKIEPETGNGFKVKPRR